jgi:hypothetical protein
MVGPVSTKIRGDVTSMLAPLVRSWRAFALELRDRAADAQAAQIVENLTRELEQFLATADAEMLTPAEAQEWSGYSTDHLRRLVDTSDLTNYGKKGSPLYRRSELPMKPASRRTHLRSRAEPGNVRTREQIARAAITPFVGGRDG